MKNILEKIRELFEDEKYDEAIELINISKSEYRQTIHPQLLVLKGMCIQLSENSKYELESAKKAFEDALQIDKDYENAIIELAYYYLNIGNNIREAIKLFKKAMDINKSKLKEITNGLSECAEELEMENAEYVNDSKGSKYKSAKNPEIK
jgi:tetratricopeptide (TPR) repeat protein